MINGILLKMVSGIKVSSLYSFVLEGLFESEEVLRRVGVSLSLRQHCTKDALTDAVSIALSLITFVQYFAFSLQKWVLRTF